MSVLSLAGNVANGSAGLMSTLVTAIKAGTQISSLADLARPCQVVPITVLDSTLRDQPYIEDVLKMCLSQFAGYYLQALTMVLGVGRIDTLKVFDSLNPYRSVSNSSATVFSRETYKDGLPSLEAFSQKQRSDTLFIVSSNESSDGVSVSGSDTKVIYENESLAVGKLLNVEVTDGKEKSKIPVMIRLVTAEVPPTTITHLFSAGGRDTWSHRLFLARSGQIRFWRDFVLGQDMIDAHFKALMNDKSGVYKAISDRRSNNIMKAMQTGKLSLADASNIAIVTEETLKSSTQKLYGRIEDKDTRDKIFDNSFLLLLVVVHTKHQRVTVYHRGLDLATTYRLDQIKAAEKSKGQDITDIFKMFSKQMQTNI